MPTRGSVASASGVRSSGGAYARASSFVIVQRYVPFRALVAASTADGDGIATDGLATADWLAGSVTPLPSGLLLAVEPIERGEQAIAITAVTATAAMAPLRPPIFISCIVSPRSVNIEADVKGR